MSILETVKSKLPKNNPVDSRTQIEKKEWRNSFEIHAEEGHGCHTSTAKILYVGVKEGVLDRKKFTCLMENGKLRSVWCYKIKKVSK
jgi:hypothetical protein